jgi:hypothetical protein
MRIRLENSLIRGEIDCREQGQVKGRLWLLGRSEPLDLELQGLPSRDLAGLLIGLRCEYPPSEQTPSLLSPQKGHVLECTGSGRRRVPVGAEQEIHMRVRKRIPHEWAWRNVLHVEWVNAKGANVILEATGLAVQVLESAVWTPTPEEEREGKAIRQRLRQQWEENQSFDRLLLPELVEETAVLPDAEKEADLEDEKAERLNDRIQARLEKLEDVTEDEVDRIYAEELEYIRRKYGDPEPEPLTPGQEEDQSRWLEEMERMSDEALEEWQSGDFQEPDRHPLLVQCESLQEKAAADLRESGWMPDAPGQEHPLRELIWCFHMATARLSSGLGFLEHQPWPPEKTTAAGVLVKVKQARDYLRDVLAALDAADEENLGVFIWRTAVRLETSELLQETELLILELRELLRQHD